jgi:hypothetical protein
VASIAAKRIADLAVKLGKGLALPQGLLQGVQLAADVVDEGAGGTEVDGAGYAVFAVAEAIVWPEGLAAAPAPGGIDASLLGEELGAEDQQKHRLMSELVRKT